MGNFVITFCTQLLNFVFKGDNIHTLCEFNLLNQPFSERVVKLMKQENKIETSFLILTILTNVVRKSEKYYAAIRDFFTNFFNSILNYDSVLVNSRLCMFLGCYLDELFSKNKQFVDRSINYLFIILFKFNQFHGLSYQVSI